MKLVNSVFEIAESFMKNSKYVSINEKEIEYVANDMLLIGKPTFFLPKIEDIPKSILLELIAASVNYCYFYGRSDIRPNGCNSSKMYENLMNAFYNYTFNENINDYINVFKNLLMFDRFPLLEERFKHLDELKEMATKFVKIVENNHSNIEPLLNYLVTEFPGFGSDIFLKRASLFFMQLYRRFGWFEQELHNFHVPADYQIPKMLEHYNCIKYSPDLKNFIETYQLIPKNSLQECEIRSATILTCKRLCTLTKWNVADVDTYFFTKRNTCFNPFHMTITTDY